MKQITHHTPIVFFLLIAIVLFTSCNTKETKNAERKLEVNGATLYFTENVDSTEAMRLGDYLAQNNLYFDGNKKSVKLDKNGNTYIFMAQLDEKEAKDSAYLTSYRALGKLISRDVFQYQPVDIYFTNEKFEPLNKIPFSRRQGI